MFPSIRKCVAWKPETKKGLALTMENWNRFFSASCGSTRREMSPKIVLHKMLSIHFLRFVPNIAPNQQSLLSRCFPITATRFIQFKNKKLRNKIPSIFSLSSYRVVLLVCLLFPWNVKARTAQHFFLVVVTIHKGVAQKVVQKKRRPKKEIR